MDKDKAKIIYTCFNVFRLVMIVLMIIVAYVVFES